MDSYYHSIQTPAAFAIAAHLEGAKSVSEMAQEGEAGWKSVVFDWGREYLFACRVLCQAPSETLSYLSDAIDSSTVTGIHNTIDTLINGPGEDFEALGDMPEILISRKYNSDSVASAFCAIAKLAFSEEKASRCPFQSAASSHRSLDISSPMRHDELTVRALHYFTRCVLCYGQDLEQQRSIEFRFERMTARHITPRWSIDAIDEGGLEIIETGGKRTHVASIQAKRRFQTLGDGTLGIPDEVLAQLVGQAIALKHCVNNRQAATISQDKFVTIPAIKHTVKIICFHVSDKFINEFSGPLPSNDTELDSFLVVESTNWMDLVYSAGRKNFARHLLALVSQAI